MEKQVYITEEERVKCQRGGWCVCGTLWDREDHSAGCGQIWLCGIEITSRHMALKMPKPLQTAWHYLRNYGRNGWIQSCTWWQKALRYWRKAIRVCLRVYRKKNSRNLSWEKPILLRWQGYICNIIFVENGTVISEQSKIRKALYDAGLFLFVFLDKKIEWMRGIPL